MGTNREESTVDGPRLITRAKSGDEVELKLGGEPVTIGRRTRSDLQVVDQTTSREHARVVLEDGAYWIEDLGSTHGTCVNGVAVKRHRLRHNDRIRLGRARQEVIYCDRDRGSVTEGVPLSTEAINVTSETLDGYRALLEVSRAMNNSLRLDDVLEKIIDAVMVLTGAEKAQLLLGEDASELEARVQRGFFAGDASGSHFSSTIVTEVFETGEPRIVTDIASDTKLRDQESVIGVGSIMCAPLRTTSLAETASDGQDLQPTAPADVTAPTYGGPVAPRAQIIGVIYVAGKPLLRGFTESDLALFESFAANAAVAIQNARLVTEMVEKRRLEQEIDVARKIQKSLLPQKFPELGWIEIEGTNRPSQQVGGDYFDIVEEADDTISFAIGDVSGKGVPAALLMSTLQSCFLLVHSAEPDLAKLCERVNRFLADHTRTEYFATFFTGRINRAGEMTYVSAGHNPPLLMRNGEPEWLAAGGKPLGLFPDSSYGLQDLTLRSGDLLVCYTDGVIEASDASGEAFGEERFVEVVGANRGADIGELMDAVVTAVDRHRGGELGYSDDITLLVARLR